MQKFLQDQIIILRKVPINESDLLIIALSKKQGKILLKIKGEKKLNSQFKGKINIFNLLNTQIYDSGRSLTLTEAILIKAGPDGHNLTAFNQTQEISKLLNSLLPDNTPTPEIFEILNQIIQVIDLCDCQNLSLFFLCKLLQAEGYLSPIKPPENLESNTNLQFYVDNSGTILPTTNTKFENPFLFHPNTIKVINFFLKTNYQQSSKLKLSNESHEEIIQCLRQIFQNNLNIKLNLKTQNPTLTL